MQTFECEFKFAKLDIYLKIKPDSGSTRKFEKLKLWHSCEIYLKYIGTRKLIFVIDFQIKKIKDKI